MNGWQFVTFVFLQIAMIGTLSEIRQELVQIRKRIVKK